MRAEKACESAAIVVFVIGISHRFYLPVYRKFTSYQSAVHLSVNLFLHQRSINLSMKFVHFFTFLCRLLMRIGRKAYSLVLSLFVQLFMLRFVLPMLFLPFPDDARCQVFVPECAIYIIYGRVV